ncbi:hypothetical protein EC973_000595 [Apophysomyces ossiformis]|uniref:PHD-type domain-containing protein n=1 Tax=Apophysomyces ossiformis TaxID=679940 RepID=A0A8H7EPW7_9FUNG|nr:hypothetical protein EC973_000595 [Apophysomyces ossiformis]
MTFRTSDPNLFQLKAKTPRQRRRVTKPRSTHRQLVSILSQKLQHVPDKPHVLVGVTLFVDKIVTDAERITQRALDLGATVKATFDNSVTHVVHGVDPAAEPRGRTYMARVIENNVHVVSSAWIDACYTEERRMEETCLPQSIGDLMPSSVHVDDNPFGIDQEELQSTDDEESIPTAVTSPQGSVPERSLSHSSSSSSNNSSKSNGSNDHHRRSPHDDRTSPTQEEQIQRKQERSQKIAMILANARKAREVEEEKRKKERLLPPIRNPDPTAKNTLLAREERVDIWLLLHWLEKGEEVEQKGSEAKMNESVRVTRSSSPTQEPRTPSSRSRSPTVDGNLSKKQKSFDVDIHTLARRKGAGNRKSQLENGLDEGRNNDYCYACGGAGRFLCCDACPKAFHFSCVEPPMDVADVEKLKDKWFCRECSYRQQQGMARSTPGLFQKLMDNLLQKNPKAFQLPEDIRTFFEGVSTNRMGEYVDSTSVKSVKYKYCIIDAQSKRKDLVFDLWAYFLYLSRNGLPEEPDYHQLKDKNGKFIVCFRCRKTALSKPIISCDYCPLYWHMDCLNPPMAAPPNLARKWMCPNHVEHALPLTRRQRKPLIIDSVYPCTANNGDIEIISDDSDEDMGSQSTSEEEIDEDNVEKVLSYGGLVYRLPAKAIKLDFMDYAKRLRSNNDTLLQINHASTERSSQAQTGSNVAESATEEEAREWLEGLAGFQNSIAEYLKDDLMNPEDAGLRMLVRAALNEERSSQPNKVQIDERRYQKCLAIERLMQMKGEDALMKILTKD